MRSRGLAAESLREQRPPRPRAFRLDDCASRSTIARPMRRSGHPSQHGRSRERAGAIDEAELEVEAAQKSGLLARWRFSLGEPRLDGPRRPRLARLRPLDDEPHRGPVRQGRIARDHRPRLRRRCSSSALIGAHRARDHRGGAPDANRGNACRLRQGPRGRRPRRGAPPRRPARRALPQPAGDGPRPGRSRGRRAGDHRRARPHRRRRARAARGRSTTRRKAKSPPPPSASRW